jgi:hypothetical protein
MDMAKFENVFLVVIFLGAGLILFNQIQISSISSSFGTGGGFGAGHSVFLGGSSDLSSVDVSQVSSTAMAIATLYPELEGVENQNDAIAVMIPTGAPEYSDSLGGITFDDPVNSMEYLAKLYYSINGEVKSNDPETWQRYLNLAAAPRGISCEFCCGIGPQGISADGTSRCGCKHNPAVLALTLGLMQNTEYSDAEVLKEVMKWKTMFFPKDMVGLGMQVAGTDPSQLAELPGMVGGC